MATLYITEYTDMGKMGGGEFAPAAEVPSQASQTVAIGAAAQSANFNVNTRFVRLHCDAICSVLFGSNPTATTANMRLAANQTEYFFIPENTTLKLSVITNT